MLETNDPETIQSFVDRKLAQWAAVSASMPGLQLIRSGERGTQVMLVLSQDDRYEGVVIGQLPHVVVERTTAGKNVGRRFAPNEKKPFDKRLIDLTDSDIAAVLGAWRAGRSALTVSCVTHVYDGKGQMRS